MHLQEQANTVEIIASHESDFFVAVEGSPSELGKGQVRHRQLLSCARRAGDVRAHDRAV